MLPVHRANCIVGYITKAQSTQHLPKQRIIKAGKHQTFIFVETLL